MKVEKSIANITKNLKSIAKKTIKDCTFKKQADYFSKNQKFNLVLPSGDEKYLSFWVRDFVMMAESQLFSKFELKKYIEIIATCGQNGEKEIALENGLIVPPFAIADHVNYNAKPVFFPGTYNCGDNQGNGEYGFYPPYCDNYYFVILVGLYLQKSNNYKILEKEYNGIKLSDRIKRAFSGYGVDKDTQLLISDKQKFTVDWGFTDTIKKSGKLLFSSLIRYSACKYMSLIFKKDKTLKEEYVKTAVIIKENIIKEFFDDNSGWFYSSTGVCHQHDVWGTAYAVFLGINSSEKTLNALYSAYKDKTAVVNGYVRQILTTENFSNESAWENTITPFNKYQNGAFWATPTGWYAYALYLKTGKFDILNDFIAHTKNNLQNGAPVEWFTLETGEVSGLNYGTSGVLPYVGALKIKKAIKGEI